MFGLFGFYLDITYVTRNLIYNGLRGLWTVFDTIFLAHVYNKNRNVDELKVLSIIKILLLCIYWLNVTITSTHILISWYTKDKRNVDTVFTFKFGSGCITLSCIFWDIISHIWTFSVSCCWFDSARMLIPIRCCVNTYSIVKSTAADW